MRINGMNPKLFNEIKERISALKKVKDLEKYYEGDELQSLQNNDDVRKEELELLEYTLQNHTPM